MLGRGPRSASPPAFTGSPNPWNSDRRPGKAGGHYGIKGRGGANIHIHHNYFTTSYAIEFPRNNVEIDHNLFDFDVQQDGGNLISGFGGVAGPGLVS
jgi:hypothetical protein